VIEMDRRMRKYIECAKRCDYKGWLGYCMYCRYNTRPRPDNNFASIGDCERRMKKDRRSIRV